TTLSFLHTPPTTTSLHTLSLHDALPIYKQVAWQKRFLAADGFAANALARVQKEVGAMVPDVRGDVVADAARQCGLAELADAYGKDRKSTRLNFSHRTISYAVFCLKKKIK